MTALLSLSCPALLSHDCLTPLCFWLSRRTAFAIYVPVGTMTQLRMLRVLRRAAVLVAFVFVWIVIAIAY